MASAITNFECMGLISVKLSQIALQNWPHILAELRDRITEEVNTILRHIKLNAVIRNLRKRFYRMLMLADIFSNLMNLYGYLLMNSNTYKVKVAVHISI